MRKTLLLLIFVVPGLCALGYYILPKHKPYLAAVVTRTFAPTIENNSKAQFQKLRSQAKGLKRYIQRKGFSNKYAFLIDMGLPSGKKRFFVFDLQKDTVVHAGLVAHGSCNQSFRSTPYFSNEPNTGCSSEGKYKVGYSYRGRFGKSYKLHGLDSSNSNAFKRAVVLHAYDCVPDEETIVPLCNSLGCPMISYNFRDTLAAIIDKSRRPILLMISGDK